MIGKLLIGLEILLQLPTKFKIIPLAAAVGFGAEPNTQDNTVLI